MCTVKKTTTPNTSELQELIEMLTEYLSQNYEFRHNVISDTYEFRECGDESKPFRALTREARNSIIRRIKLDGLEIPTLDKNVDEYIYSEETPQYDPVKDWLLALPKWDGKDRVRELFDRIPGITDEQHYMLATWLRSAVAHWMGIDMLHGNESVITLIGIQGCGKSTFFQTILPPHLRSYFLDHLNLGNKNDKEMALTNNLLVNLDELDQIKTRQQAELKQTLSKVIVNGRPIYGRAQKCRKRYASFVATTNNLRPLNDPTGSRRFLCIHIPDGLIINNKVLMDYDQLFAQVVSELNENQKYWFTPEENHRIEELNKDYQRVADLEGMLDVCFRHPKEGEMVKPITVNEILTGITTEFPSAKSLENLSIRLGMVLKAQNYERKRVTQGSVYYIVPKKIAA